MRAQQNTKKIGKRTYTLKELAQRDFIVAPKDSSESIAPIIAPAVSLVNIQEDLLDESTYGESTYGEMSEVVNPAVNHQSKSNTVNPKIPHKDRPNNEGRPNPNLALSIEVLTELIAKEVSHTAKQLDLEAAELQAWLDLQVMAPKQTLLALLRLSRANYLDPLKEEVALALYEDGHWQAYITVEGYSKMLNCHPGFDGIVFTESPEVTNGVPIWMECTIYRKDRRLPIVIREYFEEVKGEQTIWQKMPRRMLRHRTMQQCARLAIG